MQNQDSWRITYEETGTYFQLDFIIAVASVSYVSFSPSVYIWRIYDGFPILVSSLFFVGGGGRMHISCPFSSQVFTLRGMIFKKLYPRNCI